MYGEKVIRFFFRFRFPIIIILAIVVIGAMSLTRNDNPIEENEHIQEYVTIDDVPGVSFEVLKSKVDSAQAVLEVSKNTGFLNYQTYMYKNGYDTYMLFNIQNFIVVCSKGTQYNLKEGTDILERKSLNGIRFTPTGNVSNSGNTSTVDVTAQVVITNEIYNDFYGQVTTITTDECEYTLFVGNVDKKSVTAVTDNKSFKTNKFFDDRITQMVAIDVESGNIQEANVNFTSNVPGITIKEIEPEEKDFTVVVDPKDYEQTDPIEQEIPKATDTEDPTKPLLPIADDSEEELTVVPFEDEIGIEEAGLVAKSNQLSYLKEEGMAYSSDIYSMLSVGDMGFANVWSGSMTDEKAFVLVTGLYDSKETQDIVNEYAKKDPYYSQIELPQAMHWGCLQYDVKYMSDDAYLNICIKGLDGEQLLFRGLKYSTRTYDILTASEDDGWHKGNYVLFAIPNGCTEYVIQFGDRDEEAKAYYHIKE